VVYADWFKGYGQLVIVNHGQGYHSLYGNLSEIFLKAGDIIERDTKIGRVGTSGMLDRPSLYFEVRYKGRPLNPSQWLARK
jgi:septal ring factor EnvC (AmiA/AmiB activator)